MTSRVGDIGFCTGQRYGSCCPAILSSIKSLIDSLSSSLCCFCIVFEGKIWSRGVAWTLNAQSWTVLTTRSTLITLRYMLVPSKIWSIRLLTLTRRARHCTQALLGCPVLTIFTPGHASRLTSSPWSCADFNILIWILTANSSQPIDEGSSNCIYLLYQPYISFGDSVTMIDSEPREAVWGIWWRPMR